MPTQHRVDLSSTAYHFKELAGWSRVDATPSCKSESKLCRPTFYLLLLTNSLPLLLCPFSDLWNIAHAADIWLHSQAAVAQFPQSVVAPHRGNESKFFFIQLPTIFNTHDLSLTSFILFLFQTRPYNSTPQPARWLFQGAHTACWEGMFLKALFHLPFYYQQASTHPGFYFTTIDFCTFTTSISRGDSQHVCCAGNGAISRAVVWALNKRSWEEGA